MKKILFVADVFSEDYLGGAELTTDAIIDSSTENFTVRKIRCSDVKEEHIKEMKDVHWIICNFSHLSKEIKLLMCKNLEYSIIEYDYKFCNYRSLDLHKIRENMDCDCLEKQENKINLIFYGMAKKIWFMSESQRNIFLKKVKTIKEDRTSVLSSVFKEDNLNFIEELSTNKKNEKYIITSGGSWVKGYEQTVDYARNNNIDYEVVPKMGYKELLKKMSMSKGLLFMPAGADTCPRLVIEAKLLGCDLILNNNVQHKDEEWFSDRKKVLTYLKNKKKEFWKYYE